MNGEERRSKNRKKKKNTNIFDFKQFKKVILFTV